MKNKFICQNQYFNSPSLSDSLISVSEWVKENPRFMIQHIFVDFYLNDDGRFGSSEGIWEVNVYYDPRIVKDE